MDTGLQVTWAMLTLSTYTKNDGQTFRLVSGRLYDPETGYEYCVSGYVETWGDGKLHLGHEDDSPTRRLTAFAATRTLGQPVYPSEACRRRLLRAIDTALARGDYERKERTP